MALPVSVWSGLVLGADLEEEVVEVAVAVGDAFDDLEIRRPVPYYTTD